MIESKRNFTKAFVIGQTPLRSTKTNLNLATRPQIRPLNSRVMVVPRMSADGKSVVIKSSVDKVGGQRLSETLSMSSVEPNALKSPNFKIFHQNSMDSSIGVKRDLPQLKSTINKSLSILRSDVPKTFKFGTIRPAQNPIIGHFNIVDQIQAVRQRNLYQQTMKSIDELNASYDFDVSGSFEEVEVKQNHFDRVLRGNLQVRSLLQKAIVSAALIFSMGMVQPSYAAEVQYPIQGNPDLMAQKNHGTCPAPVQDGLRFGSDFKTADNISCYNRNWAEFAGYAFQGDRTWVKEVVATNNEPITYYDSVSGKPLFKGPIGRDAKDFVFESKIHGWPSFRDQEVVWENVRTLKNGEVVSVDGTHLGHNLPDGKGNRYCINLVSISGNPPKQVASAEVPSTTTTLASENLPI